MARNLAFRFFQLLLVVIGITHAYYGRPGQTVNPGSCPSYPAHPNFDSSLFSGNWTVATQFSRTPRFLRCQNLKFTLKENNKHSFRIEGSTRFNPTNAIETGGESFVVDEANPAQMKWTWKFFPTFVDQVTVLDTDYVNYAIIVLCNDYGLFHTKYPILMTREIPLNVTKEYEVYFNRAQKVFPFSVYTPWNAPQICYFERDFADKKLKSLDVDEIMKKFNQAFSGFTN